MQVADADLWEAGADALLYFELVLVGGRGNITLNSTTGLYLLSDSVLPSSPAINTTYTVAWQTGSVVHQSLPLSYPPAPLPSTGRNTPQMLVANGASIIAGYGDIVSINQAFNGIRITPTAGYFGAETLKIAISDRGLSSACLNPVATLLPPNTPTSSFGTTLSSSFLLTTAYLNSSSFALNKYFNGTTQLCTGPWLWSNSTTSINVLAVNNRPQMNFTFHQSPFNYGSNYGSAINYGSAMTLNNPPTFRVYEDSLFSLPPMTLTDREQTLSGCANNNYALVIVPTNGVLSLKYPSVFAASTAAGVQWVVGTGGNDTLWSLVGPLPGTIASCFPC